jgi:hypothetical protein
VEAVEKLSELPTSVCDVSDAASLFIELVCRSTADMEDVVCAVSTDGGAIVCRSVCAGCDVKRCSEGERISLQIVLPSDAYVVGRRDTEAESVVA